MNLQDLPDMSDALKKVQQFDEKKKLDPVGKEDGDVVTMVIKIHQMSI